MISDVRNENAEYKKLKTRNVECNKYKIKEVAIISIAKCDNLQNVLCIIKSP